MAIKPELMVEGNILSNEELERILNPLTQEQMKQIAPALTLNGFIIDIKEYYEQLNEYLETGDTRMYNSAYKVIQTETKVILFHKRETDVEGTSFWSDCSVNDEGAEPYEYNFVRNEYSLDPENEHNYITLDDEIPEYLKAVLQLPIININKNLNEIRRFFIDEPVLTSGVAIEILNDVDNDLNRLYELIKQLYENETFFNVPEYKKNLIEIKNTYLSCADALEDIRAMENSLINILTGGIVLGIIANAFKLRGTAKHYTGGQELDENL